jgi:hypothetical protein
VPTEQTQPEWKRIGILMLAYVGDPQGKGKRVAGATSLDSVSKPVHVERQ